MLLSARSWQPRSMPARPALRRSWQPRSMPARPAPRRPDPRMQGHAEPGAGPGHRRLRHRLRHRRRLGRRVPRAPQPGAGGHGAGSGPGKSGGGGCSSRRAACRHVFPLPACLPPEGAARQARALTPPLPARSCWPLWRARTRPAAGAAPGTFGTGDHGGARNCSRAGLAHTPPRPLLTHTRSHPAAAASTHVGECRWQGRAAAALAVANIFYGLINIQNVGTGGVAAYTAVFSVIAGTGILLDGCVSASSVAVGQVLSAAGWQLCWRSGCGSGPCMLRPCPCPCPPGPALRPTARAACACLRLLLLPTEHQTSRPNARLSALLPSPPPAPLLPQLRLRAAAAPRHHARTAEAAAQPAAAGPRLQLRQQHRPRWRRCRRGPGERPGRARAAGHCGHQGLRPAQACRRFGRPRRAPHICSAPPLAPRPAAAWLGQPASPILRH